MDHLAADSGHVSNTVKHSQCECAVVVRLEDNQVISVCANPYRQVWTRRAVMRSVRNLLALRQSKLPSPRPGLSRHDGDDHPGVAGQRRPAFVGYRDNEMSGLRFRDLWRSDLVNVFELGR